MKYGHIADHEHDVASDLRHRHIGALLGASSSALPESVDHSHHLLEVPDQGGTSSCVGQAFATAIFIRAAIAGNPIPRPSPKAIYDMARLVDAPRESLHDEGSRPRAAILGLQDYGMVAESRWPLTDANVNQPPPLDVFQHGLDAMLTGYYRIGSGPGAATLIRQALAKGFIPAFAMDVDMAYEQLGRDEVYDGPKGPLLGGHMQAFSGYGPGYFIVAGSWSSAFARDGFARVTDAFVERGASDILVCTTVPTKVT